MRVKFLLPAVALLGACSGSQLRLQREELAELRRTNEALAASSRERAAELDTVKAAKADADAKRADASDKLAAANGRVDVLTKSNKDLSDAIGASENELGARLKAVVAEKDALAKSLAEAQKERLAAERLKGIYRSARDKAAADLAAAEKERVETISRLELSRDQADKEKARAAAELEGRRSKRHEELGSVADAILPDIQAGRAFASTSGDELVVKLSDALLFAEGSAKLTDAGAEALERVGRALKALGPREIRVEAHTDAAPLKRGLLGGFEDHWALSAAQAAAATRVLGARAGLDPARLSAVADAEFHPFPAGDDGCPDGRCVVIQVAMSAQALTE